MTKRKPRKCPMCPTKLGYFQFKTGDYVSAISAEGKKVYLCSNHCAEQFILKGRKVEA